MKKLTACLLAAILAVCMGLQPVFAAVSTNAQSWARPMVEKAYENGIATETLLQKATSPITRAEFCQSAMALYEQITGKAAVPSGTSTFTDCSDPDVLAASELKIISGMGDGTFRPDSPLTREQLCIILSRLLNACGIPLEEQGDSRTFTDISGLKETSQNYIHQISAAGFMSGYTDGTFLPHNSLRVQEALVVLVNVMEYAQEYTGGGQVTTPESSIAEEEGQEESAASEEVSPEPDSPTQEEAGAGETYTAAASVSVHGKKISVGMTVSELKSIWGEPSSVDDTVYGLTRYVYDADDNICLLASIQKNQVITFYILADEMVWNGKTVPELPSQMDADIRISAYSHSGIYEDDTVQVMFPMDYIGQIRGVLVTDLTFAKGDHLTSGTNLSLREDIAEEIFALINTLRVLENEEPLVWEENLAATSVDHSADMVKQNYFDYNNPDGTTPFARMQKKAVDFHTASEVIANVRGDVPELFTELLKNTGRFNIITDETMTHAGVGVASNTKTLYLTMDMCGF
ncbi:S-layer homology domain-containing protein [Anaerotignum lactatifermentans]|uniref:S-layer homology domain-containing protein n=1 Tax=Anaerotignum lactatifermentans TaxID=160404 RepID=A0ABS2G926_9FIRM|nr:S-layer homology domain-containing protein [Anaerotignum lactatifermentans]MBM6828569.1 S-layer homology domain-containing protein [Anaerotignum lactatifermentans]MBM6877976.1 S-layer homology domain-containing protein [Anaerotignum lactatifermentans]MBM6950151.1 S-layer homology domain-containing protein [Anaerotignum lactatifermentans]